MKTYLIKLSLFLIIFINCLTIFQPTLVLATNSFYEGKVIAITETGKISVNDELLPFQTLKIQITKGTNPNSEVTIQHIFHSDQFGKTTKEFAIGDQLRLVASPTPDEPETIVIDGQLRRPGIMSIITLFIIVVIIVGRIWGVLSLLGLTISFGVIFLIIVPLIMSGLNPVLSAIIGSIIIIPSTFYISHGINSKTHIGIISTILILILVGLMSTYFVQTVHLTGFATEEAGFLAIENKDLNNMINLIIAGIIIATLGALDDITVGQASVVQQLKKAKPHSSVWDLFQSGMKVGQDHISALVNTLILVYTGASLPLILLFYNSQVRFLDIIEHEIFAEEIVRMLVSSTGLVLAAPLATLLAAWVFSYSKSSKPLTKKNNKIP